MTREEEAIYLESIRDLHGRASTDWTRRQQGEDDTLVARLIPQQPPQPVAVFDQYADRHDIALLAGAHAAIGFLLEKHDRAVAYFRSLQAQKERLKPKDFAAECAMKCADPLFQRWLHEVHGLDHPDSHRATTKVRGLLAIRSRGELNDNPEAAQRWISLRAAFDAWRKT